MQIDIKTSSYLIFSLVLIILLFIIGHLFVIVTLNGHLQNTNKIVPNDLKKLYVLRKQHFIKKYLNIKCKILQEISWTKLYEQMFKCILLSI